MKNKTDFYFELDDYLQKWHLRNSVSCQVNGFPKKSVYCKFFKSNKNYDGDTTTFDDDAIDEIVSRFDKFMDKLFEENRSYYYSLCQDAKNINFGVENFNHPQIKKNVDQKELISQARDYVLKNFFGVTK